MSATFRQNLQIAIHHRFGMVSKDKQLADLLKVDRSTVNRLRNAKTVPHQQRLNDLARVFGLAADDWTKPSDEFQACLFGSKASAERPSNGIVRAVSMPVIASQRFLWPECARIHNGQYIAYWKAHGISDCYVASLIDIGGLDSNGIRFSIVNPYIRDDADSDEVRSWRYEGVLYPVADYLYFFGEQVGSSYELFTMIMTASPIAPPDILRGCLSGIYVRDGKKQIAVNIAVAMLFLRQPIKDWRAEVGRRLGKLASQRIPGRVRRLIEHYPGVLPLEDSG